MALIQPQPDDPRWIVDVTSLEHHEHANDAWEALSMWNGANHPHPPILLRGDTLTRVSYDEKHVKLAGYSGPSLTELLSEGVIFVKVKAKKNPDGTFTHEATRVECPRYIPTALLNRTPDKLPDALRVNRVVEVPVYGGDGKSVLGVPGYDPESRTYYQPPPGFKLPALMTLSWGDRETHAAGGRSIVQELDVQEAVELIHELLCDFPFTDEASYAHAVAMLLEPFVREVIGDEPTPMYAVLAHTPGTGKGLLTQVCLGVSCGTLSPMTWTGGRGFESAEARKRMTAALLEGRPVMFYDNVTEPMDDANLAMALTAIRWSDRQLGHTKMIDVPIRNVWVMTANNPTISRELTRRMVPIFLDPGDVDPLTRTSWTHQLPQWATEHRADLVAAALTIAANYFEGTHEAVNWEGEVYRARPETADVLASYPAWSRTLGGILKAAGIPGFLDNLGSLHAHAATENQERAAMLRDWHERQVQPYSLDELLGVLGMNAGWPAVELPLELRGHGDKFQVKLGVWLRDHRDEVIGGYRLRKVEGRPARWTVEKIG